MTAGNGSLTATHLVTVRQSIHETVRQLNAHLGLTAVSYLSGAKDMKRAAAWARADGAEPRDGARRRLLAAHRCWMLISSAENDYVARNWFIGANPHLGERSPIEVLRDGDDNAVLTAATAFAEGTDG